MKSLKKSYFMLFLPFFFLTFSSMGAFQDVPEVICTLKVNPVRANVNDPIQIDISDCKYTSSVEIGVFDSLGKRIKFERIDFEDRVWFTSFSAPGDYLIKATALNLVGTQSLNECEVKVHINFPPICRFWTTCLPCYECVNTPVIFNSSDSYDPDGTIVRADFQLIDEFGAVINTHTISQYPFDWILTFASPGRYRVVNTVTDDFGVVSKPCFLDVEIRDKRLFFFVEMGPLYARESRGIYAAARFGVLYELFPHFIDLVFAGGGALALEKAPSQSFFLTHALVNFNFSRAFIGLGLGYSTEVIEEGNQDFEFVGQVGTYLFNYHCRTRGAIFFEYRGSLEKNRPFSQTYKLMLGFRYLF